MLFTKKTRFSIEEKHIKEETLSNDGKTLVRLNLRYPAIVCSKRDCLSQYAVPFYEKTAQAFAEYARTGLKESAVKVLSAHEEGFRPFSAVMRFEKTYESDSYLSILLDMSVSNGVDAPVTERLTQVWDRKNGRLCKLTDFIDRKSLSLRMSESTGGKKHKSLGGDIFVLREKFVEVFFRDGEGYKGITLPL